MPCLKWPLCEVTCLLTQEMKAQTGEGVGVREGWQVAMRHCWPRGPTSECSTLPQVPGEESAAASFQPVPTSCLTDPAALGWHLPHLSTLFSGSSSPCPLPLVPTSAPWMAGLFPLAIQVLSKASLPITLFCFSHLYPTWSLAISYCCFLSTNTDLLTTLPWPLFLGPPSSV